MKTLDKIRRDDKTGFMRWWGEVAGLLNGTMGANPGYSKVKMSDTIGINVPTGVIYVSPMRGASALRAESWIESETEQGHNVFKWKSKGLTPRKVATDIQRKWGKHLWESTDDMRASALHMALVESQEDVLFHAGLLGERQKRPAAGDFPDESKVRQGSFKVGAEFMKMSKEMTGGGPETLLFKEVRDHINSIPRDDLPKIWGLDNIPDAQDEIARAPRKAFQAFLRNVHKVDRKLAGYIRRIADNAPLVFYGVMLRISGRDMADTIFNRYFTTKNYYEPSQRVKMRDKRRRKAKGMKPGSQPGLFPEGDAISQLRAEAGLEELEELEEARSGITTMGRAVKAKGKNPGVSFWHQVSKALGYNRRPYSSRKEQPYFVSFGGGSVPLAFGRVLMSSSAKVEKTGSGYDAVGQVLYRNVKDRVGNSWHTEKRVPFPHGWEGMGPDEVAKLLDRAAADAQEEGERSMILAVNAKKYTVEEASEPTAGDKLAAIFGELRQEAGLEDLDEAARPKLIPGDTVPKDLAALWPVLKRFGFKRPKLKREVKYEGTPHQYTMVSPARGIWERSGSRKKSAFTSKELWELSKAVKEWATKHGWTHKGGPRGFHGNDTDSFAKMQPKLPTHKVGNEATLVMRTSGRLKSGYEPGEDVLQNVYFNLSYATR